MKRATIDELGANPWFTLVDQGDAGNEKVKIEQFATRDTNFYLEIDARYRSNSELL